MKDPIDLLAGVKRQRPYNSTFLWESLINSKKFKEAPENVQEIPDERYKTSREKNFHERYKNIIKAKYILWDREEKKKAERERLKDNCLKQIQLENQNGLIKPKDNEEDKARAALKKPDPPIEDKVKRSPYLHFPFPRIKTSKTLEDFAEGKIPPAKQYFPQLRYPKAKMV